MWPGVLRGVTPGSRSSERDTDALPPLHRSAQSCRRIWRRGSFRLKRRKESTAKCRLSIAGRIELGAFAPTHRS